MLSGKMSEARACLHELKEQVLAAHKENAKEEECVKSLVDERLQDMRAPLQEMQTFCQSARAQAEQAEALLASWSAAAADAGDVERVTEVQKQYNTVKGEVQVLADQDVKVMQCLESVWKAKCDMTE